METKQHSIDPTTATVFDITDPTCDWMQARMSFLWAEVQETCEVVKTFALNLMQRNVYTTEEAADKYLAGRRIVHQMNGVTSDYRTRTMKRDDTIKACVEAEDLMKAMTELLCLLTAEADSDIGTAPRPLGTDEAYYFGR